MNSPLLLMRGFSIRLRMHGAIAMVLVLFGLVGVTGVLGGRHLAALNADFMPPLTKCVQHSAESSRHATPTSRAQGIGQINGAVSTLHGMTQQNAAPVEKSAAAAESLKDQAGRLNAVVARFQVHGHSGLPA